MSTTWELNPIALNHINRFFQAANLVARTWREPDDRFLKALMELSGNMLWARSSFVADNREEEQSMAYSGAFVGALAELAAGGDSGESGAVEALDLLERQMRHTHDAILAYLARDLRATGLGEISPARLNAEVWQRLFPEFSYELSLSELGEAIREWLVAAAPA